MLDSVEWGEFRIEDILEWQNGIAEINPLHLDILHDENSELYPFYGQAVKDNGIISFNRLSAEVLNNSSARPTLLIHSNNQNIVYVETPFYLKDGHGATSVLQADWLNKRNALYLAATIEKSICQKFNYQCKATKIALKNTVIPVPVKNGHLNLDFMEKFVAELEARRSAELEAYLSAAGLKDYTLSEAEAQALAKLERGEVAFAPFKVVELFHVKNTANILARDITDGSGSVPYLSAGRENNAVSAYISYDDSLLEKGNCIFIGGKTFVVTYQPKDFFSNDSHNLCLYFKGESQLNRLQYFCLISCLEKSLENKYSWGDSISKTKIQSDVVFLPVTGENTTNPDYSYMQTLLSAIQKTVIKDVVQYADRKIAATQSVIGKNNSDSPAC
ncbi:Restriction enzyme BgcI subunit beta [Kingella potus]|uniref:Restriction enzyme BgcI subunit beta n=1 Tax=Kingella potus TaxID=265175 RepID=A0A377QZZ9_9NEIS|nr:restriction endonuclease subunit S [Kingella potus]UOP01948.1 restriction endonuclease subunit S [Kingella potus]STR00572.1 Restriction enzyme BgcI subunit beta [Kingella potus]